jgi:hypothetical protein
MIRLAVQEELMGLIIEFDRSVAREPSLQLGPFEAVELRHRRIVADGHRITVRKASGIWEMDGGYLEVRIRSAFTKRRLSLMFSAPWRNGDVTMNAGELRLVGDRLWDGGSGEWIASDLDDGRTWVLESSGDAYDRVLAA